MIPLTEVDRLTPNNISDVALTDDDSGLRLFRGMISPWDQIKSFKETYNFTIRHAAIMGIAFIGAMRIIEPDYAKRTELLAGIWGEQMDAQWSPEAGMHESFEEDFDMPPFFKSGVYRAATYADEGDELMLMAGHVTYVSNDRVEKEIHVCQMDIIGPEACDVSVGGGQHFCTGLACKKLNNYDPERIGCGDLYCVAVMETEEKYGEHKNKDGYQWEEWGPVAAGVRLAGTEHKKECEHLTTGKYIAPTGAEFTTGQLYRTHVMWPLFCSNTVIDVIRATVPEDKLEWALSMIDLTLEIEGKALNAEWNTRKATREWMGVPADVDDTRVMGGYISMVLQARSVPWEFIEFEPERTVVQCDTGMLDMLGSYPEFERAYAAFFNGVVKTLVNTKYTVYLGDDADEGTIRFVIERIPYGYRTQNLEHFSQVKEVKA
jgi:hypothetical protein